MINHFPPVIKFVSKIPVAGEITLKAEKAGYKIFEENLIIETGESVTLLVEMEKGE